MASAMIDGNEIVARCLKQLGVEDVFFIMGAPMLDCEYACGKEGIRLVDVRHEQAAAMMATAYSRLRRTPSVCMAASGPGVTNLVTGIANAWADGAPVIALGGASSLGQNNMLSFQEIDQLALFKPITRWADRVYETSRLPEYIHRAFRVAYGAHPGPVYLDLPGDVLYRQIPLDEVQWVEPQVQRIRPRADELALQQAVDLLAAAERPLLVYGTGVIWSGADEALNEFVDVTGIPFFATPQGRGVVPEDHDVSFLGARGIAFSECDLIVQVATRQSYVLSHLRGSRWSADAPLIQIDIDADEIGRNRHADVPLVGDARAVLRQLIDASNGRVDPARYVEWRARLAAIHTQKGAEMEARMSVDATPIHPLRLCKALRDALPRDAVLTVDGAEILSYARQSIPFFVPRSLNSGPFGTMGVGLPLAIGAKVAMPDTTVVALHGDGSFGLNAMEMDTAIRHDIPIVCVISNNGGWTANDPASPNREYKPGRELGFTRYDLMFDRLGAFTAFVEDANHLAPAIHAALDSGKPALINVLTDPAARAGGTTFAVYET
jgi:thiamine pyrophosphate-dependent acetolactate synthase large subunit-like protein